MAKVVVSGTLAKCSFGNAPCPLIGLPKRAMIDGKPIATSDDKGFATFGLCSSQTNPAVRAAQGAPVPCVPVIAGAWRSCAAGMQVNGKAVLTNESKITCVHQGMIAFQNGSSVEVK